MQARASLLISTARWRKTMSNEIALIIGIIIDVLLAIAAYSSKYSD